MDHVFQQYFYGMNPDITLFGQNTLQAYDRGFKGPATLNCQAGGAMKRDNMYGHMNGNSNGMDELPPVQKSVVHCCTGIFVVLFILGILLMLQNHI